MSDFFKSPAVTLMRFSQDEDTDGRGGDHVQQDIEIECVYIPSGESSDGNPERYYVIKTERWAFNSISELAALLVKAGCAEKME